MNAYAFIPGKEEMKFILQGRTFDTAASKKVAVSRGMDLPRLDNSPSDCEIRYEKILFRTVQGAFWIHEHSTRKFVKGGKPLIQDKAKEVTPEVAVRWIEEEHAAILDDAGLPLPRAHGPSLAWVKSPELYVLRDEIKKALAKEMGADLSDPSECARVVAAMEQAIKEWNLRSLSDEQPKTELEHLLQRYRDLIEKLEHEDFQQWLKSRREKENKG
jgi:hypothetical protein